MKKYFVFVCAGVALCLLASCGKRELKAYNEGVHIIPAPLSLTEGEGHFLLKDGMTLTTSAGEAEQVTLYLAERLRTATGYRFDIDEDATEGNIALRLNKDLAISPEGYHLEVSLTHVMIQAKTAAGLFYGVQTFLQLLPAEIESPTKTKTVIWTAPTVVIDDAPRFGYRGIMLDVCRHFLSVERIKKQLDVLALFKINRFHWHLTDDQGWRIDIKKHPKLTQMGSKRIEGEGHEYAGFYTQEEIKEVIDYAAARFITIVPEIEMPGHALAAISAYPELSCKGDPTTPRIVWGVEDIVFCAGKEETFLFLEDVIAEVAALFPGEYIHLGGDECPKRSWEACPLCQKRIREEGLFAADGHSAEERLQSYFVQRMEKVVARHGKKMIGWDEILEGGLAPSATVMSWRGEAGGIAAANMGHDVIMTPSSNGMYIDYYQGDPKVEPVSIGGHFPLETVYSYDPVPQALVETGKTDYIRGVQGNLWAEYLYTPDMVEYRAYPRILAISEIAWTQPKQKSFDDFLRRLDNAMVRLDLHDINYHIPQPEQPGGSVNFIAFTDTVDVAFKTTRPIRMIYTLDGSEPTVSSPGYTLPIRFTESGTIKIRSILASGKMSPVRTITVEKQSLHPAKDVQPAAKGLKLDVTYGTFLRSADISDEAEWTTSVLPSLSKLTQIEERDWGISIRNLHPYAAVATGYVDIPADGVYFFSSDNEEVWIDGKLLISNAGEVKRFSHHDTSVALAKGLHEIKVVFLSHIIGGWPTVWGTGDVSIRQAGEEAFQPISPEMLSH
ncbi:MAG: family 20 glycosylhydrolase [Tannerellaceae bacterium]|jgi:hexosaminidase|nr:family 20 glycosylhydrolase [Tannerellaceae bacterium]